MSSLRCIPENYTNRPARPQIWKLASVSQIALNKSCSTWIVCPCCAFC